MKIQLEQEVRDGKQYRAPVKEEETLATIHVLTERYAHYQFYDRDPLKLSLPMLLCMYLYPPFIMLIVHFHNSPV